jgi:hypothetical protein
MEYHGSEVDVFPLWFENYVSLIRLSLGIKRPEREDDH